MRFCGIALAFCSMLLGQNGLGVQPTSSSSLKSSLTKPTVRVVKNSARRAVAKKSGVIRKSSTRGDGAIPERPKLEVVKPFSKNGQLVLAACPANMDFDLPTDNQMLFSGVNAPAFFQPTYSGRTISAMFGYVRNPGAGGFRRFHEGIDIRPTQRDDDGEPVDDVRCAGAGVVRYICDDEKDSNYGKYVVVEHSMFGSKLYTLYAHLASVEGGMEVGDEVEKGHKLGVLGRTSNEFEIDAERAHLHFEVNLMRNSRDAGCTNQDGEGTSKHGAFNGSNLLGIDPVRFFQFLQRNPGAELGDYIATEHVAFRVLVPRRDFTWLHDYPFSLTKPVDEGTKALEVAMTYYGLPVSITPRTKKEIGSTRLKALSRGMYPVTYTNRREISASGGGCSLIVNRGGIWALSGKGTDHLRQLTL